VVDAAVGLQNRGHRVIIFTNHCDPQHCFDEARNGTLDVRVRGNSVIPPSIFSRFSILCAILRQLHLILAIWVSGELSKLHPSAFIVDQLSACLPILRIIWPEIRIFFYCHFPDLLLVKGRSQWWKQAYRKPFDWIEQWSMGFADAIAVNSGFTKGVVSKTWPLLAQTKQLDVVYPCVDVKEERPSVEQDDGLMWKDSNIILSINRFEAKKDVGLAIRAFAGLGRHGREGVRLVVAGGYDHRVQDNVVYHQDLIILANSLGLKNATTANIVTALRVPDDVEVLFLLSVPSPLKDALLRSARLLVYTPSNEHFGIVPLEAMLVGTPVLAANTGGPLETVIDGKTGWLCDPDDVEQWTNVMNNVLHRLSKNDLEIIGEAGKQRVRTEFSDTKMAERMDEILDRMETASRRSVTGLKVTLAVLSILPSIGLLTVAIIWKMVS